MAAAKNTYFELLPLDLRKAILVVAGLARDRAEERLFMPADGACNRTYALRLIHDIYNAQQLHCALKHLFNE
jgi:hypothetical protein